MLKTRISGRLLLILTRILTTTTTSTIAGVFRQLFQRTWEGLRATSMATTGGTSGEDTPTSWAYAEDIPGSRCGPDDGPWPRSYTELDEADIWRELGTLAKPQSVQFDASQGWKADSVNFQPSPSTRTQDRYVVKQLSIHGRAWELTGVFDGRCCAARAHACMDFECS